MTRENVYRAQNILRLCSSELCSISDTCRAGFDCQFYDERGRPAVSLTTQEAIKGRITIVLPPNPKGFCSVRDVAGGLGIFFKGKSKPSPIMDALYAAAVSEQMGWETSILDGVALELDEQDIVKRIRSAKSEYQGPHSAIEYVGVRLSLATLTEDVKLAGKVKSACPQARVFVFGSAIKHTYQDWIESANVDFVLYGEVDAVLPDILSNTDCIESSQVTLVGDEEEDGTMRWKLTGDLDRLPVPAWHLLPLAKYSVNGQASGVRYFVQTSRGCPNRCSMCPYILHQGRIWRKRSIEGVIDELAYLKRRFGAREVLFRDPNIGVDVKRLRKLCERIIEEKLDLRIHIETELEKLDEQTIALLKRSGVFRISTGVESVDPNCLTDIAQNTEAPKALVEKVAYCNSIEMEVFALFMVGFPHESWASVLRTLSFAKSLGVDTKVGIMNPYPGTEIAKEYESANLISRNTSNGSYRHFDGATVALRSLYMSKLELTLALRLMKAELMALEALRKFYARPSLSNIRYLLRFAAFSAFALPIRAFASLKLWSQKAKGSSAGLAGRAIKASDTSVLIGQEYCTDKVAKRTLNR